jgi:hypothetical protein
VLKLVLHIVATGLYRVNEQKTFRSASCRTIHHITDIVMWKPSCRPEIWGCYLVPLVVFSLAKTPVLESRLESPDATTSSVDQNAEIHHTSHRRERRIDLDG